jgi:hypothetical protein
MALARPGYLPETGSSSKGPRRVLSYPILSIGIPYHIRIFARVWQFGRQLKRHYTTGASKKKRRATEAETMTFASRQYVY